MLIRRFEERTYQEYTKPGPADRRVLPSLQRPGGRRRRHRGRLPEGQGLPDQRLSRSRPLAGAGHGPEGGDGRAVRPGDRLLQGQGRVDALLPGRGRQHGRARDRRRADPAGRRDGLRGMVQEDRRRLLHALRRRRDQPGHVQRIAEPGEPAGSCRASSSSRTTAWPWARRWSGHSAERDLAKRGVRLRHALRATSTATTWMW